MKKVLKYKKILVFAVVLICFLSINLIYTQKVSAEGFITPTHIASVNNNDYSPFVCYPEWSAISGHYLYVGNNISNSITVFDITDPGNLVQVGSIVDGAGGAKLAGPKGIAISGNYLYVSTNSSVSGDTLEVLNISDPIHPVHAGSLVSGTGGAVMNNVLNVTISGNYAYLPSYSGNALEIVNITDPTNPVHAGIITNGTPKLSGAYGVVVVGNYAYVTAVGSNALEVVNISNPASPTHVTALTNGTGGAKLSKPWGIARSGNYLYITSYVTGGVGSALEVVNITTPTAPTHAGSLVNGVNGAKIDGEYEIVVSGNYAYLDSYLSDAIDVVDISNPASPTQAAVISDGDGGAMLGHSRAFSISGNYLYVPTHNNSAVEVVDITNPLAPVHKSAAVPTVYLGNPRAVKVLNNRYAYVLSQESNAVQVVDVLDPAHPVLAGSLPTRFGGGQVYAPVDIAFSGHYAYVALTSLNNTPGGIEVMDTTDPAHPTHVTSLLNGAFTGGAYGVAVSGNYLYVTCYGQNALEVLDISNPASPVHAGSLANGGGASLSSPYGITISGHYAYIASSAGNALEVVDIIDPTHPAHAGVLSNGVGGALLSGPRQIYIYQNYAYIASFGSNALEVVNITTPTAPSHAGSLAITSAIGISGYQNRVYVSASTGSNSIKTVDISNPTSPTLLSTLADGTNGAKLKVPRDSNISGDYLYVATYDNSENSLEIIRIKDSVVPIITLQGSPTISITQHGTYVDAGATASDDLDGNITANITTVNNVDTNTLGTYTVTYNVSDTAGNPAVQVTRTVDVVDTTVPIITMTGTSPVSVNIGNTYTDAGATAFDDVDGNITANIVTTSNVNTNALGTYHVNYNVVDSSNNHATQITRTVNVVDTTSPIITLLGSSIVSITQGSTYVDAGATAVDDVDGNITSSIVTVNNVNTNIIGTYIITYNVTDSSGNHAIEVTRTVEVKRNPSGGYVYGCKDPKAINYSAFVADKPSLCKYQEIVPINIPVVVSNPSQYILTKNLKYKMTDIEVKYLQIILNKNKDTRISFSGIGSSGKETKYFGKATLNAVKKFQVKHNLKADGVVGQKTRSKLMETIK